MRVCVLRCRHAIVCRHCMGAGCYVMPRDRSPLRTWRWAYSAPRATQQPTGRVRLRSLARTYSHRRVVTRACAGVAASFAEGGEIDVDMPGALEPEVLLDCTVLDVMRAAPVAGSSRRSRKPTGFHDARMAEAVDAALAAAVAVAAPEAGADEGAATGPPSPASTD